VVAAVVLVLLPPVDQWSNARIMVKWMTSGQIDDQSNEWICPMVKGIDRCRGGCGGRLAVTNSIGARRLHLTI